MPIRVRSAWFVQPAAIAAKNETYLNAEKNTLLDLELIPQGLLVRVKGWKGGPFIVGNTNLRSVELYEEPAAEADGDGKRGRKSAQAQP